MIEFNLVLNGDCWLIWCFGGRHDFKTRTVVCGNGSFVISDGLYMAEDSME